jgi:hypothetical protein
MKNVFGFVTIRLTMLLPFFLMIGCETNNPAPKPGNYVIVMIDRSLSFSSRQQDAIDRTVKYLDQIASRKVGRWEGKRDKVIVISLDAVPAVLWEGNPRDLKTLSAADWKKRFAARTDYEKCTDITGAFALAAERFASADAEGTDKFLLAYTDLLNEPPLRSASSCAKPHPEPTEDFPWASLQDVSVNVFWLPINQKLIWERIVKEKGLGNHFALYSNSESGAVEIAPPPPAKQTMTESERAELVGHYRSIFQHAGLLLLGLAGLLVFGFLGMVLFARRNPKAPAPQMPTRRPVLTPEQLRARNGAPTVRRG